MEKASVSAMLEIDYYKDMTMVSHTPLLYGAYWKEKIEDEQYDTLMNHNRLKEMKESGMHPVDFVLKYITSQYGGSIALVTTSCVKHLEQNVRAFNMVK